MQRRSKLSLNALRTFEAVARHRSMVGAADELLVTPGAVSRQIADLQSRLQFDLFVGPTGQHILTAAGQELAAGLTKALDQIEITLVSLDAAQDTVLDVACLSTFAVRWLIPRLHRFRAGHAAIDLRLSTDPRGADRIDVSILALAPTDPLGLQDTVLFRERLGVVVAPALAVSQPDTLAEVPFLTSKTRANAWECWAERQAAPLPHPLKTSTFEHLSLAIEAAAAGLGFCITPEHLVRDDIASNRLSAPFGFCDSGYAYVARSHGRPKRKVSDFVAWLVGETRPLCD